MPPFIIIIKRQNYSNKRQEMNVILKTALRWHDSSLGSPMKELCDVTFYVVVSVAQSLFSQASS
jgi:hypothetical protein